MGLLSVIVPCYNEEETVADFYEEFIKKDKYTVLGSYSPNGSMDGWEVNVEDSMREYLTLYIKSLQPSLDYWNKYKNTKPIKISTKTTVDDPDDIF